MPGMKEEGLIALDMKAVPVPSSNGLVTGKVLIVLFDVCAECGTYYVVASKVQQGQIQTKPGQMPQSPSIHAR